MSYICKYCHKKLSSQSSLNVHIKRAKYCIDKRGNIQVQSNFKCSGCKKDYTSRQNLNIHMETCFHFQIKSDKEKYSKDIQNLTEKLEERDIQLAEQRERYEKQIKELQDKLENVAIKAVQRPTTSNKTQINNYIQNMKPVTDEYLLDNVQHLTIEHIKKGVEGYAEYALEYPLKDRVLCSDYSRRKVKFKDKDGNVITDPEMTTLARKFFHSIKEKNKELICQSANELKEKLGDDNVMDTVVRLFDYKSDIEKGSDGEKTDFHHDFVKQVCSQTVKE
jgi:DNA-binding transcriptional MerR regulator